MVLLDHYPDLAVVHADEAPLQAAGILQVVVAPGQQFGDGVRGEEFRRDALFRGSQVTALAPFSQNWDVDVGDLSGHAQPGQSKPSGLLVRRSSTGASGMRIWSATALAVAFSAPQPPAGAS
jgi:hypothetical protein